MVQNEGVLLQWCMESSEAEVVTETSEPRAVERGLGRSPENRARQGLIRISPPGSPQPASQAMFFRRVKASPPENLPPKLTPRPDDTCPRDKGRANSFQTLAIPVVAPAAATRQSSQASADGPTPSNHYRIS